MSLTLFHIYLKELLEIYSFCTAGVLGGNNINELHTVKIL